MKNSSGELTGLLSALAQRIKGGPESTTLREEFQGGFYLRAGDDGFSPGSLGLRKAHGTPWLRIAPALVRLSVFLHLMLVSEMTIANDYIRFSSYCS
jgi:hypothetical protein